MRLPALDERLQAAADLFTACDLGADIGADHGRLSCYLLFHDICKKMIVSDISDASLQKARHLLDMHGLTDRADFRVSDGLDALSGPVQCAAICGMGGRLMSRILLRGQARLQNASLVLSCHTEIPLLRQTLCDIGYHITREQVVRAKGRFYIVLKAEKGLIRYTDKELYLGPVLLKNAVDPGFQAYLRWREDVVSCEKGHDTQLQWIREEINHG